MSKKIKRSEESIKKIRKYQYSFMKEKYTSFNIRLNKECDDDVIKKLQTQENITGYIRKLIKKDIKECDGV